MNVSRLAVELHPDPRDIELLEDEINAFNLAQTGIPFDGLLSIFVRDEEGNTVAGIYGWTWGGCCEIRLLWVREDQRGLGYGSALLGIAEREAAARGCSQCVLDTHSFQAPAFYRRCGYEVIGVVDDYPRGHQKMFFRKALDHLYPRRVSVDGAVRGAWIGS